MSSGIQPRESIYYLSALASALQNGTAPDETNLNRDDALATGLSENARTLNLLSTCLTRGTPDVSKIIAVTACVLQSGVSVAIATSPHVSPTSSPTVSPSSSAGDVDEASGQKPSESGGASHRESQNESREELVLARNSSPTVESGQQTKSDVPSGAASVPLLETILALQSCGSDTIPIPEEFSEFVAQSLSLLRGAAVYRSSQYSTAHIREAVCLYFLSACRPKLESRLQTITSSYDLSKLLDWEPTERNIASVKVKLAALRLELIAAGAYTEGNDVFIFDTDNVCAWWKAMVLCLFALQTALTEKNIKFVYMASGRLHTIVKNIPVSFWALSSLGCHLQHCRKKALNDGDDDETKDKDGINETLPAEGYLVAAIPECVVFKRVVDAVCAWTTGPTNLLRSKIARSPLVASVSILDLPRAPIRKISYPELIDHWMKTTKWSGAKLKKVTSATQHIRDKDLEQQKGASHCEAGLMASLLLPSNPDVSSVDEPRVVSRAFENFESAASHLHYLNPNIIFHIDPITIGVAKKCCPLCRILSDSLSQHYKLSIELPGQHSRYFTWVAPHWLPPHILQDIEARLLRVVTSMLMDGVGSRSSSPGSDEGRS